MLLASIIALVVAPQVVRVEAVLQEQLGSLDAGPEQLFGRIADLAADAEGNVYILDNQTNDVRVFSPFGEYLGEFGRGGRGPGELNRPIQIDVRGETVTVLNPSGQANGYTLAGELFTSRPLPFGTLSTTRIDELNYAVFASGGIAREDPVPIEFLLLMGPGATDTILTVPSSDILFRSPTSSALLRTSLCRLAYFVVGDDGEFWVASGSAGTLTEWRVANGTAEPGRSASLAPQGVPLPDSTRSRILGLVPRQISSDTGDLSIPPVLSSICGMERSADGTMWVRFADLGGQEKWMAVDVETLRPTLELTAPEGVEMKAFSGRRGYGTWTDESGVPHVGIYRLE